MPLPVQFERANLAKEADLLTGSVRPRMLDAYEFVSVGLPVAAPQTCTSHRWTDTAEHQKLSW